MFEGIKKYFVGIGQDLKAQATNIKDLWDGAHDISDDKKKLDRQLVDVKVAMTQLDRSYKEYRLQIDPRLDEMKKITNRMKETFDNSPFGDKK